MKKFLFAAIFILGFSVLPQDGQAYQAIQTHATRLSDDTVMFTITSRFSYMNYGLQLPLLAKRNGVAGEAYPFVGYALYTKDGTLYT